MGEANNGVLKVSYLTDDSASLAHLVQATCERAVATAGENKTNCCKNVVRQATAKVRYKELEDAGNGGSWDAQQLACLTVRILDSNGTAYGSVEACADPRL